MTPTIDSSPPLEVTPPASNLHLLEIDSSVRTNNHQQISANSPSSSSSSSSISSSSESSSRGSQSDTSGSSKPSPPPVLLTLESKLLSELEDEEEYEYEALPENTSLTANLLAGATAGIMVS